VTEPAFRGWTKRAVEFYEGLEADNSRTYWHAHKGVYDEYVRKPMEQLTAALAREFGEAHIFRPNRDTRFSADKSPYKTAIAAHLGKGGYIQFSADGLGVGSGMYMMASDQLERYRRAVDDNRRGTALEKLVGQLEEQGIEVTGRDQLKTAPKGYAKDHPRIELLRNKGLHSWQDWPFGRWLSTLEVIERVSENLRATKPLMQWLNKNVGPSALDPERR
jgi:uncharacterized protein (TIGR02453 family)